MKKFFSRLIIIIAITLVADRALAYVVSLLYKTTTTTDEYKINTVTLKMNEPVVFMGSSRAHHHYVPSIISDSLRTGVYNAGLWGMRNIYFQYAFLCNILERYKPQTICLEIHPIDYLKTPFSGIDVVNNLTPFIGYSPGCDSILKKSGVYYKAELSHLYRYNSQFANLVAGNLSNRSAESNKGFKGLTGKLNDSHGEIKPEKFPYPVDDEKVRYLQAFINKCQVNKINLVFLYSTMYAVEKNVLFEVPEKLAKNNHIPFINNYNLEGITNHPELYHDYGHLNELGAKKYSAIVASQLKKYIQTK